MSCENWRCNAGSLENLKYVSNRKYIKIDIVEF